MRLSSVSQWAHRDFSLDSIEGSCCAADWPTSTRLMLGKGAVNVVTGDSHMQLRKVLRPAFSMSSIAGILPKLGTIAEQCLSSWAAKGQVSGMLAAKEFTFRVGPGEPILITWQSDHEAAFVVSENFCMLNSRRWTANTSKKPASSAHLYRR